MPSLGALRLGRLAVALLCTALCFAVGVSVDLGEGRDATINEVVSAALFSPLTVPIGGAAVVGEPWRIPLALGGLAFWPVYLLLVWQIVRAPRWWLWLALTLWATQGFWDVVGRMDVMMSA